MQRPSWMTEEPENLFSGGQRSKRHDQHLKKPVIVESKVSDRELNPIIRASAGLAAHSPSSFLSSGKSQSVKVGDGGNQWQMMKIRRIYEQANRDRVPVEKIALEKFGTLEEFHRLDSIYQQQQQKKGAGSNKQHSSSQPSAVSQEKQRYNDDTDRKKISIPKAQSSTLINVSASETEIMSLDELNRLNAKVIKAKLMKDPKAAEMESEYHKQLDAFNMRQQVQVIPNIDSNGRLVDLSSSAAASTSSGNAQKRRRREEDSDSRDDITALLLAEKTSGQSFDEEYAHRIAKDTQFGDSLDYMDEHADKLSKKIDRTVDKKRQKALQDYKITQKALDNCWYCFKEDGRPPVIPAISSGHRIYLGLPKSQPLVPGHCLIIPHEHNCSMLECGDDEWDEIRNYMKCIIRMSHAENKGVVFMETSLRMKSSHNHAMIECFPIPYDIYDTAPAYFRQEIMTSAEEWSQHKKIIDTSQNGFRRSLVKQVSYFHVWFGLDKGLGHVIEDEERISRMFGREIIGGIMKLPVDLWRKPKILQQPELDKVKERFNRKYQPFDWTSALSI